MKYNTVVNLIFNEIYENGISLKSMRLYCEHRISYKKFLKIQKDVKNHKIQRGEKRNS